MTAPHLEKRRQAARIQLSSILRAYYPGDEGGVERQVLFTLITWIPCPQHSQFKYFQISILEEPCGLASNLPFLLSFALLSSFPPLWNYNSTMGVPVGPGMFKAALADTPREAFNWRLAFSVICFGLMVSFDECVLGPSLYMFQGAARGLDEGLIGTTVSQKSFISGEFNSSLRPIERHTDRVPSEYHLVKSKTLDAVALQNKIGNITAMVQIGSVGGALIAFIACDKIGTSIKGLYSENSFANFI
jgi:hypothetical protein